MTDDNFDRLLEAMPQIAEAVNAFKSESVQQSAFSAIMNAANLGALLNQRAALAAENPQSAIADEGATRPPLEDDQRSASATSPSRSRKPRKPAARMTFSVDRDLNLRPAGKEAFKDFAAQKDPSSHKDKNLVCVYYLETVLELENVGVPQVLAAYKEMSWRPPSNPENSLQVTASQEATIDTKNMKQVKITHRGRNVVDHDLPRKQKSSK